MNHRKTGILPLARIVVSGGRELHMPTVQDIASSIADLGLLNPINVAPDAEGKFRVISGRHRLAAVRSLGHEKIAAIISYDLTEIQIRLAEISENLHRAELTALERSEQIDEFARLVKEKHEQGGAQVGHHPSNAKGASGREGGDSAAARDLGLTRQDIQRAEKIANITPEAKAAAKEAGLDDNQSALLKVAAAPEQQQVMTIKEFVAKKERRKQSHRYPSIDESEQHLGKTANCEHPGKDASEPRPSDENRQRPPYDMDATVSAILRDYNASEVRLIINALTSALTKALTEENAKSPAAAPADVRSTVCDLAWPDTEGDKRQDLELSAKTPGSAGIEVAGESLEDFPSAQADNPSDAYGEEIEPIPETNFRQEAEWCESHASRSDEPEWAHETVEISELEWT